MRTHCQFTVKRPEKRVGLTVAPEPQPCGVQVVELIPAVNQQTGCLTKQKGDPLGILKK